MKQEKNKISGLPAAAAIFLIRCYKASLAQYLGGQCRFVPSCSDYAMEAIAEQGFIKGGLKAIRRILKCNPFGAKGFDPPKKYES